MPEGLRSLKQIATFYLSDRDFATDKLIEMIKWLQLIEMHIGFAKEAEKVNGKILKYQRTFLTSRTNCHGTLGDIH